MKLHKLQRLLLKGSVAVLVRRMISRLVCVIVAVFASGNLAIGQTIDDPSRIEVYVTPYYNSKGPVINVGPFSKGLAENGEAEFVATIAKMKQAWDHLTFPEMYVAAIRLYDLGFRNEATYWFYSAQYRGRLLASLVDREEMGSMGDPGFELVQLRMPFSNWSGHTLTVMHSATSMTSFRLLREFKKKTEAYRT